MMRVLLINDAWDPILRQTPGGRGDWDGFHFTQSPTEGPIDYVVVCERFDRAMTVRCPREHTLFVTWEPPTVRSYNRRFLSQFAAVMTPHRDLKHPRILAGQPALPWTVGVKAVSKEERLGTLSFDDFAAMTPVVKTKPLSVICSAKAMTDGHRQRLKLLDALRAEFGDAIDVYGQGFNEIEDKWDAILPYKYHIVLENCELPDYWSEKLADCFLGFAYPIYSGASNIGDYFPEGSMTCISRDDIVEAVRRVREVIEADTYGKCVMPLGHARSLVLGRHNFFATVVKILRSLPAGAGRCTALRPEWEYTFPVRRRIKRKVKHLVARAGSLFRTPGEVR